MIDREVEKKYTTVAVLLHWVIASLIIANLVIGSFMESLPNATRVLFVRTHASFGFTILLLTVVRILWRVTHQPPPFSDQIRRWERRLASFSHACMYLMMLAMPLLGWLIVSSSSKALPITAYGMLRVPAYPYLKHLTAGPAKVALHADFVTAHATGAWIFVALITLHVGGALKHQLQGIAEVQRMWSRKKKQTGPKRSRPKFEVHS